MDYLDRVIADFEHLKDPVQQRIAIFEFVRNIPYFTGGNHDPGDAVKLKRGNCASKSYLLGALLEKLGYKVRYLIGRYKLRSFPEEVRYLPDQADYHHVVEVLLGSYWVTVDATYDPPLAKLGFQINNWDGVSSTSIAENLDEVKYESELRADFDKNMREWIERYNHAYMNHREEIDKYSEKFNEILEEARKS